MLFSATITYIYTTHKSTSNQISTKTLESLDLILLDGEWSLTNDVRWRSLADKVTEQPLHSRDDFTRQVNFSGNNHFAWYSKAIEKLRKNNEHLLPISKIWSHTFYYRTIAPSRLGRWSKDPMVQWQWRDGAMTITQWYDSATLMVRWHDDDDDIVLRQ